MRRTGGKKERIVVADDDALFASAVRGILEDVGYAVETCSTAEAALDVLAGEPAAMLIADIFMPGNERLQLVKRLKTLDNPVQLVLVTGRPSLDSAIAAVGGASAYVTKPVEREQLLCIVSSLLRDTAASMQARAAQLTERWGLTPRERDTLELLALGRANKEMAGSLGCGLRTVEIHVSSVLAKSGQGSRAAIAVTFWRHPQ